MFHADRRSADRRCNARPEDRAGNMRTRGVHRGQEVHAERFPFQTNPTSRLTARTESLLRGILFYADLRWGFAALFLHPIPWPASCRQSAAASPSGRRRPFFGLLSTWLRHPLLADAPTQRLHQVATTLLAATSSGPSKGNVLR